MQLINDKINMLTSDNNISYNNIISRTSVRQFLQQPIENNKVDAILHAAMSAPSACNKQPWRFIVITQKDTLVKIAQGFPTSHMAKEAPLAIAVCGDKSAFLPEESTDYWVEDTSAASENILLAANALGLGAVWTGIYPLHERVEKLRLILHIPETVIPMGLIIIGYPLKEQQPKDKWKPEYVHYEKW